MTINLSEKLKSLRKEKGISQEKLAEYLGVSFQAVSKWENDNTYPDISLLPEIARFFGITVDDLLQVEKLDEKELYSDYERRAGELFRIGKTTEALVLWQEAYKKMPNNIQVKEMLMSSYYDADKIQYKDRIIELGMEIYGSDAGSYYKVQAIREIANTYAAAGNMVLAEEWCISLTGSCTPVRLSPRRFSTGRTYWTVSVSAPIGSFRSCFTWPAESTAVIRCPLTQNIKKRCLKLLPNYMRCCIRMTI